MQSIIKIIAFWQSIGFNEFHKFQMGNHFYVFRNVFFFQDFINLVPNFGFAELIAIHCNEFCFGCRMWKWFFIFFIDSRITVILSFRLKGEIFVSSSATKVNLCRVSLEDFSFRRNDTTVLINKKP